MSPSPVRAMSALERTDTTCGADFAMLRSRYPRTTISSLAPGIEISTSSSSGAGSSVCGSTASCAAVAGSTCAVSVASVSGTACAIATEGATSADVMSNRLIAPSGFNIVFPSIKFKKGWGARHLAAPHPNHGSQLRMSAARCRDRSGWCPMLLSRCCTSSQHTRCRSHRGPHRHKSSHRRMRRACLR